MGLLVALPATSVMDFVEVRTPCDMALVEVWTPCFRFCLCLVAIENRTAAEEDGVQAGAAPTPPARGDHRSTPSTRPFDAGGHCAPRVLRLLSQRRDLVFWDNLAEREDALLPRKSAKMRS